MFAPAMRQSTRLVTVSYRRYASTPNRSPSDGQPQSQSQDAAEAPLESTQAQPSVKKSKLDLVQTGPSLAEEYMEVSDVAPAGSSSNSPFGERTGAKAKGSGTKSSIEKKRSRLAWFSSAFGVLSAASFAVWLGRPWSSEEERQRLVSRTENKDAIKDAEEQGFLGTKARAMLRFEDIWDYFNKPAWDPLLPAPLPEPHYRPYTLVIDLDDLLVSSLWDTKHGWRTVKRPGVEYFLGYLSQFYEIVLFTTQPAYTAAPIVEKLDPYGAYIPYKLFRESTRYKNGALIKDLTYLGRPIERTIVIDTKPEHVQLQPENSVLLQPWNGTRDESAKELIALIPFLEALVIKRVKDVRPVIKHYEGKNIPIAYAEAEAKQKQQLIDQWERDKVAKGGFIASSFGSLVKAPDPTAPPLTEVERVRKAAQKQYLEEQKYWKENEATLQQQMEEDRQRQLKEMKGSLATLLMGGGQPPVADGQQQQQKS